MPNLSIEDFSLENASGSNKSAVCNGRLVENFTNLTPLRLGKDMSFSGVTKVGDTTVTFFWDDMGDPTYQKPSETNTSLIKISKITDINIYKLKFIKKVDVCYLNLLYGNCFYSGTGAGTGTNLRVTFAKNDNGSHELIEAVLFEGVDAEPIPVNFLKDTEVLPFTETTVPEEGLVSRFLKE